MSPATVLYGHAIIARLGYRGSGTSSGPCKSQDKPRQAKTSQDKPRQATVPVLVKLSLRASMFLVVPVPKRETGCRTPQLARLFWGL